MKTFIKKLTFSLIVVLGITQCLTHGMQQQANHASEQTTSARKKILIISACVGTASLATLLYLYKTRPVFRGTIVFLLRSLFKKKNERSLTILYAASEGSITRMWEIAQTIYHSGIAHLLAAFQRQPHAAQALIAVCATHQTIAPPMRILRVITQDILRGITYPVLYLLTAPQPRRLLTYLPTSTQAINATRTTALTIARATQHRTQQTLSGMQKLLTRLFAKLFIAALKLPKKLPQLMFKLLMQKITRRLLPTARPIQHRQIAMMGGIPFAALTSSPNSEMPL